HLLAGAAADAQGRIHVRLLHLDGRHLGVPRAVVLALPLWHLGVFSPNRLGRRGTELLAHNARRRHRPRQATTLVVHGGADRDGLLIDAHLLLLVDLLDGPGGTYLAAEHARELAVANAGDE